MPRRVVYERTFELKSSRGTTEVAKSLDMPRGQRDL